jgi:hypothetical protein
VARDHRAAIGFGIEKILFLVHPPSRNRKHGLRFLFSGLYATDLVLAVSFHTLLLRNYDDDPTGKIYRAAERSGEVRDGVYGSPDSARTHR